MHYLVKDWVKFLSPVDPATSTLPLIAYIGGVGAASCALYYSVEVPGRIFVQRLGAKWAVNSPAPRRDSPAI